MISKHDLKNELLRIESIFEILIDAEDSPFSMEKLLSDGEKSLSRLQNELQELVKAQD